MPELGQARFLCITEAGIQSLVLTGHSSCVLWSLRLLCVKGKLEDEFPMCLYICGEGPSRFFQMTVGGKLVHSKKRCGSFLGTQSRFQKLGTAIKVTWLSAREPESRTLRSLGHHS